MSTQSRPCRRMPSPHPAWVLLPQRKMKTEGNLRKPAWAADEFGRGLEIEIVDDEGVGLTIVSTDQCPYLDGAAAAQNHGPSAFGVFGVVFNRALLSYHYLLEKNLTAFLSDGE